MGTRTYALVPVSKKVYEEIKETLEAAGYTHAFSLTAHGKPVIDMQGLAIAVNEDIRDDD